MPTNRTGTGQTEPDGTGKVSNRPEQEPDGTGNWPNPNRPNRIYYEPDFFMNLL